MSKTTKATASIQRDFPGSHTSIENLTGGWTASFSSTTEEMDMSGEYVGFPDDKCPMPHVGYMLKGRMTIETANGLEVFEAGDAFSIEPGHTPKTMSAGSEVLEFVPTEQFMAVAGKLIELHPEYGPMPT